MSTIQKKSDFEKVKFYLGNTLMDKIVGFKLPEDTGDALAGKMVTSPRYARNKNRKRSVFKKQHRL